MTATTVSPDKASVKQVYSAETLLGFLETRIKATEVELRKLTAERDEIRRGMHARMVADVCRKEEYGTAARRADLRRLGALDFEIDDLNRFARFLDGEAPSFRQRERDEFLNRGRRAK